MSNQAETEVILLVYVGSRISRNDKLMDLWLLVTQEEFDQGTLPTANEGDDHYCVYGKQAKKYIAGQPGTAYEVPRVLGTTSIYPTDGRYKGLWPNDEQRLKWQAEHRTAVTTIDLRKQAKKEGAEDNFAPLRPLRGKYAKLISQNQRAALLAQVIAYLTAGPVKEE